MILFLDKSGNVDGCYFREGTLGRVALPLRDILTHALVLDCSRLLLGHNHPSGDAQPSETDVIATRRLFEAASMLDLELIDHCIFTAKRCFSFRAAGLM